MLESILLSTLITPLSNDFRKNSFLSNFTMPESCFIDEKPKQNYSNYYDLVKGLNNVDKIQKQIYFLLNTKQISANVFNNAYGLIGKLPEYILAKIEDENIYSSNYGTIMVEFEFGSSNLFSLEIGKDCIGYFSEINNRTISFCEKLDTITEFGHIINFNVLKDDLELFLNKLKIA